MAKKKQKAIATEPIPEVIPGESITEASITEESVPEIIPKEPIVEEPVLEVILEEPIAEEPITEKAITEEVVTGEVISGETDPRPESSPFASTSIHIYFSDENTLSVPSSLLKKSPKLLENTSWPPSTIRLNGVTSAVGHVLFYYLLTDTYQCLRPKGVSLHERVVDEFTTGVRVYIAARKYELPSLKKLAQDEIRRLADELPFPLVLNLLQSVQLNPSAEDTWVSDYVQSGLKNLFENPTKSLECSDPQAERNIVSFSDMILKNLAELLVNGLGPPRKDSVTPSAQSTGTAIFDSKLELEVAREIVKKAARAAKAAKAARKAENRAAKPRGKAIRKAARKAERKAAAEEKAAKEAEAKAAEAQPRPEDAAVPEPEPEPEPVYDSGQPSSDDKPESELLEAEPAEAELWPESSVVPEYKPEPVYDLEKLSRNDELPVSITEPVAEHESVEN
ncbi:hypothetical protein HD806DRAFT_532841 [Xylariaceae sp. AK1471]|nr:hypothetical protein HD806DRAFT_532841 [Xylariaceae sp. AK1471]